MSPRPSFPPAAAVVLLMVSTASVAAQDRGERCYDLRIVPPEAAVPPMERGVDLLAGPVVLTREPAGRPTAPDAHPFYRVERPGPETPWTYRGFTVWTEAPDGTIWLGGAAVPVPGGERAASARLFPHGDGVLRGRLLVDPGIGTEERSSGKEDTGTMIATVTAEPVLCDPPAVVHGGSGLGEAEPGRRLTSPGPPGASPAGPGCRRRR